MCLERFVVVFEAANGVARKVGQRSVARHDIECASQSSERAIVLEAAAFDEEG